MFLVENPILGCLYTHMATLENDDLQAIKNLIEITIEEKELVTKDDLGHLSTKDEFYEQTGEILKRLDDLEEEKDVLTHQVSNRGDRIKDLEFKLHSQAN